MADFAAEAGFDGVDLSLDQIDLHDDGLPGVLYAFALRAKERRLEIPVCHLPFYMPSPDDRQAMARFAREQTAALRAVAPLGIPVAVIHPIVRHSSACLEDAWMRENVAYLTPLRDAAAALGVTLAVENMVGKPFPSHPDETVFGCEAEHVMALAEALDTGVCWDFGHAHLSGLRQSAGLRTVGPRLRVLHVHDNDGERDSHLIPGRGSIDWQDAMTGLRAVTGGVNSRCPALDMELKASDLPADRTVRLEHAARALHAARRLAAMLAGREQGLPL
jgi:sugar phosphate isomerase/epimerase